MIDIAGRRVKLCTCVRSQTVNVCYANDPVDGSYEFKFRNSDSANLLTEESLTALGIDDLDELRDFLIQHGAEAENPSAKRTPIPRLLDQTNAMPEGIVNRLDEQVDAFLDDFIANPYAHRVEHSIHIDLFSRIATHEEVVAQRVEIQNGHMSQLVHKERPEPSRIGKSTRRGSHDIALLPPCKPSPEQFCLGFIRPFAAFELGLNYDVAHFDKDVFTLHYAKLPASYVIHLARTEAPNQERVLERAHALIDAGHDGIDHWPKLALVIIGANGQTHIKYSLEQQLQVRYQNPDS